MITLKYIIEENGSITIVKYIGFDKQVVIPREIDEKPVTTIGSEAFANYRSLTSVTIPDSVTQLGSGAFYNHNCTIAYKGGTYTTENYHDLYAAINGG